MNVQLTLYLVKNGVAIQAALADSASTAQEHVVDLGEGATGQLYTIQNPPLPPDWVKLFEGAAEPEVRLNSSSYGAVLFFEAASRLWAVTFGHRGRHLIRRDAYEPRFGIRTTLNAVDRGTLRGFDTQVFDSVFRKVVEHAAIDAETENFGIDVERDLLRGVIGRPSNPALGNLLAGADRLTFKGDYVLQDLPYFAAEFFDQYNARTYITNGFDWLDNIEPVKDPGMIAILDSYLEDELQKTPLTKKIALAVPDAIRLDDVNRYRYGTPIDFFILRLSDMLESLKGDLTTAALRTRHIKVSDSEGNNARAPYYDCLVAELELDNDFAYVLSGGDWYKISATWVASVDSVISRVPTASLLPLYDPTLHGSENRWCAAAAATLPGAEVVDKKSVVRIGGGNSQLEFCDIFDGRTMMHVKRYTGSPSLSHLFSQVRAAADGWQQFEPSLRKLVNEVLPSRLRLVDPTPRPHSPDYTIMITFIGAPKPIPFLSRVNLRRLVQDIGTMGYKLQLAFVDQVPVQTPARRRRSTASRSKRRS